MIRAGIAGATGYLGTELVRLLAHHPHVDLSVLASVSKGGTPIAHELPQFRGVLDHVLAPLDKDDPDKTFRDVDCVFLAMPHGEAHAMLPALLATRPDRVVIDLSGDHRIRDPALATATYGFAPTVPTTYGLPEWNRDAIRAAGGIANPGCYPTASILGVAPLLAAGLGDASDILVDAVSGVTGAGREPSRMHHFPEGNERVTAYKVGSHRHEPEIAQALGDAVGAATGAGSTAGTDAPATVTFTPHLVPMNRGIHATAHVKAVGPVLEADEVHAMYTKRYADAPFVRVIDDEPDTKLVRRTNFADIHVTPLPAKGRYVVTVAIDNLVKGGSGQAVQNMNIRFGFPEKAGLPVLSGGI